MPSNDDDDNEKYLSANKLSDTEGMKVEASLKKPGPFENL